MTELERSEAFMDIIRAKEAEQARVIAEVKRNANLDIAFASTKGFEVGYTSAVQDIQELGLFARIFKRFPQEAGVAR